MSETHLEISRQFISAIPHCVELGMQIEDVKDGEVKMSMPYDERFVGDPTTGVIHGGAVSALLDTCCGAAVIAHPLAKGITATIDLRIDYMRPAVPNQRLLAHATCYNVTRSVAFVRAVAMDEDSERPVAMATGAFTVGATK